jgi:signal transduction histidine kinase
MTEIGVDLSELEVLIDDILTAARLEAAGGRTAAGFALRHEEMGPDVVCARAAERFRAKHPLRPVAIAVASDLPRVWVDAMLFRRVIDNLLENAHKYTPAPDATITLRASAEARGVVFEVEDHGMGIPPDDLPHVFTPFFRGERSRSRGTGGVGLGLTLAKRIVEAHGGTIDLTSTVGSGTTVRVVVPAFTRAAR